MKYPRTYHFPWSLSSTNDDKILKSLDSFYGMYGVATIKMDGENTTLHPHCFHARSVDSRMHPSRNWVKSFWSSIKHDIPEGYRICGENVYAKHSIEYTDLESYFYGFSMWKGETCLAWNETLDWFALLGITPVKTIYRGEFNEDRLKALSDNMDISRHEGYVFRNVESFNYNDFSKNVGKFVRKNHVQSNEHWMHQTIIPNKMIY